MPLCETCNFIDPTGRNERWGTQLGSYEDLLAKAYRGCEACQFLSDVLHNSEKFRSSDEDLHGKVIVLDGLQLDVREPDNLKYSRSSKTDLCLQVCGPEHDTDPETDLDSLRIIPEDPLHERCVGQIKGWLKECGAHQECRGPSSLVDLPKRVIEVPHDPHVAPRISLSDGKRGAYVILSYAVGDVPLPDSFTSDGAIVDVKHLPKTVADAIAITRRLGYQYLWFSDLKENSENEELASIFSQTDLLLSATLGKDANSGFLHNRNVLYSPALGPNKDRYLRLETLQWENDIEYSPLAKNARAIVERTLAPRIAHFTRHQLIWECTTGYRFEAAKVGEYSTQRFKKDAIQSYIRGESSSRWDRLKCWYSFVEEYTRRTPAELFEKLPVTTPVATAVNDSNLGEYLAGIWSGDIAAGLAWSRVYPLLTPSPEYRAPSWSWASVDGPVGPCISTWPDTIMQDHENDPSWINKYQVKLLSHYMVPVDPKDPYSGVCEGSYIVVEGSCLGFQGMVNLLQDDDHFHPVLVLDQSDIFDCHCCNPRDDDVQEKESANFEQEAEHHIFMIVQGDAWRVEESWCQDKGICDIIILKTEEGGCYKRVGFMRLQSEKYEEEVQEVHEAFNGAGWERRVLKLI